MKVKALAAIFVFVILILFCIRSAHSQNKFTVSGMVRDAKTGETLIGATISVKDRISGTVTDKEGRFQLQLVADDSATLIISYVGYETKEVKVTASSGEIDITLSENLVIANEVVVTASRVSEKILEAPVTILKMDANAVKETPSENFYAALSGYKGVDVLTNSILYKTLNTRGFNNNANFRLIQLIDGVDNSQVGLGWPFGNVLGVTDIDIKKVELIPGVASALYGANAFNGLLYMTTKDPFNYQGLTVLLKNGVNHFGNDQIDPGWYSDLQLRYAKAFNNRFAFKVNFGYVRGSDWLLTDSSDISQYIPDDIRGPDNPGRNAVNIYGDEAPVGVVTDTDSMDWNVTRTGYYVKDLIDNFSYSLKANAALHYKLNDRLELSASFNFAQATTSWSSMFSLKNMAMYTGKLELAGSHFFVRAAALKDDLGETYNAGVLASLINRHWKSNSKWFIDFDSAYGGEIPGVIGNNFNSARDYADQGRLIPGTDEFNYIMDSLRSLPIGKGGAKVIDHSSKYYFQGEYDFSRLIKVIDLVAGADYRFTNLVSEGTLFADKPGSPIRIHQYALYAQATKKLFKDHLKLLAALRYDKADNFEGVWAPKFAAVYHPDDKNYFRASFQTGFRLPEPVNQYIDIITALGHRIGGTAVADAPYNSRYNSFTESSVDSFIIAVNNYLSANPNSSLDDAIDIYYGLLKKSPYDYIQPEKVQTIEAGYQRLLLDEKIYLDVNYFHNTYSGFIFSTNLIKADRGGPQNVDSIKAAAHAILEDSFETFITVVNSFDKIVEDGIEAGASFVLPRGYVVSGNFTWIHSNVTPDKDAPGIRTPPLKSNVSITNRNVTKGLGFMINWRWTDAVNNWSNAQDAANIDNSLPAYSIFDAQVSYRIPKAATSVKLGASNLLNFYHQDYAQGPSIGGLYYISLLYDGIFK